MIKKKPVIILILSVLTLFSVIICYSYPSIIDLFKKVEERAIEVSIIQTDLPAATAVPEPTTRSKSEKVVSDIASDIKNDLSKQKVLLSVTNILQLPELPTGCEITSLTIVLNYLGHNTDKEYMAKNYLEKAEPFEGGFNDYFIGSPWSPNSWGCYSPVITKSASKYLSDNNSTLHAYNTTGSSLEYLFLEVGAGNPVIVWASRYINTKTTTTPILLDDGSTAYWYSNEHCMVLIGYDLDKSTVTLCDPLNGIVEYDLNTFAARYEEFQRMGVVIK